MYKHLCDNLLLKINLIAYLKYVKLLIMYYIYILNKVVYVKLTSLRVYQSKFMGH